ncbi:MAG: PQQ-dependent sugar dehydrogenase [Verrucomicrobia bacterium]|nr:PQQ-dependent sugar dehydrogenase [Verrucomicrobiota bacterium]
MPLKLLVVLLCFLSLSGWALEREPWTTSKIQGSPEPPLPYTAERIWPHITFNEAVDITFLESEELMFITEREGKIWSLPADLNANPAKAELVTDLKKLAPRLNNALGLAFHPNFQENRQIFIHHALEITENEREVRISRFKMNDSLQIIPGSEVNLVRILGNGHMGGDIQFGPDGMLFFTIGDLAPPSPPDPNNAGQNLGTLAGKINRIDVDRQDPGLPYHIPEDNPFVNVEGARPEIWAYGFRNPWKISFHPESGEIWTGDVGWEIWEMVYRVEKGGNYGWSIMEGPAPLKQDQPKGPTPILPPTAHYSHIIGASVTGGYFVTSPRLPELQGAYIYGDYVTGKVWALDWDGNRVTKNRLIADTRKQIVSFGQDVNGDLIFLDYPNDNGLHRIVHNTAKSKSNDFPQSLSDTGLFQNAENEKVSPGVYPFTINAPTWQDGYESRYWVGLPDKGRIEAIVAYRVELPLLGYEKPAGTVLAKTIHKDGQRIETQILHWDGYWNGYSYRWNDDQTDATLVPKEGLEATIMGKPYRFPARDECVRCHGSNFHRPLAFMPGQLDKDNQLDDFLELGLIGPIFKGAASFQHLENPADDTASLDQRARSWLHANCSYCHRVSGGAGVTSMMNKAVPNDRMILINSFPEKGSLGMENARLIEPGNPYQSILYYRIATKGAGHMPMIGPKTIDQNGVRLVHDWIRLLRPEAPITDASLSPSNVEEALALYHKIQSGALSTKEQEKAIAACLSSTDPFVLNLFIGFTIN